jgi:hypothetical protein
MVSIGAITLALFSSNILNALNEPPNSAATLSWADRHLQLTYEGKVIFDAQIEVEGTPYVRKLVQTGDHGQVDQVFAITANSVRLTGHVNTDDDGFACSAQPEDYGQPSIVRHSYGRVENGLNRAVYERSQDWLISIDHESDVSVTPSAGDGYSVAATGSEVIVRFRPRYYGMHRGLRYFSPWTGRVKTESQVGWSSWYAFFDKVTQQDVHDAADVLSEKLGAYGLHTLQIDDGFQQAPVGLPETWTKPNEKFPDGMAALARYIRQRGLVPGIWLTPMVHRDSAAQSHPDLFVHDEQGKPVRARWIGYPIDGSNPKAIDTFIRPVFADYTKNDWGYFKVDALRHLRYEGYNSQAAYFAKKHVDRVEAFRNVVKAVRQEIGPDRYLMACWGIRPELTGIVDAVRIGGDGFGWECMAQYNSFNNVVWRNDPDHIQSTHDEGYRDCTVTSLTGSLYMLTDTPEDLRTKDLSAVKATIPVLFTRPGQVYDVDPTRSMHLDQVDTETSGGGPRPFDASRTTSTDLFQLDVNAGWGQWTLLARVDEHEKTLNFSDLGLKSGQPYLVYEFWTHRSLGVFKDRFEPGSIDPKVKVQLFCIRPLQDHPFVVSSTRHISCGALEMRDVKWVDGVLSGTSDRVAGDPYTLTIYEPEGAHFVSASAPSEIVDGLRVIHLPPNDGSPVHWEVRYR